MKNSFDEKILEEANDWVTANQKVVLATVIQTWGSSPRQVGSRMIVNEKGDFSGSVSGGWSSSAGPSPPPPRPGRQSMTALAPGPAVFPNEQALHRCSRPAGGGSRAGR